MEKVFVKKDTRFLSELKRKFSKRNSFRKSELRAFYRARMDGFDENAFRRIFYSLNKEGKIVKVDTDAYILNKNKNRYLAERKAFEPALSSEVISIHNLVKENFPYTKFSLWETRVLYEFMVHQPARNLIILDVEKDAAESVFNLLSARFTGKVFLDPTRETVENYVFRLTDSIIVVPMISRSPLQTIQGIAYPRLEKILVDIVADEDKYYILHGSELYNIYEGAFQNYRIWERALFWYAQRRHVNKRIRALIAKKTRIQLIQV
jgi:hypothetical protein